MTYKVAEIIGCRVMAGDDEVLGELIDVLPTGGNDVFVVKQGDREICIPALKTVIISIDVPGRLIRVDLPAGLMDVFNLKSK